MINKPTGAMVPESGKEYDLTFNVRVRAKDQQQAETMLASKGRKLEKSWGVLSVSGKIKGEK